MNSTSIQSATGSSLSLIESNAACKLQIQQELNNGLKVKHASISQDILNPKDYFSDSEFWNYAAQNVDKDWHYCISKLQTKTQVISQIYVGTLAGALVDELCRGDYSVKSNEYYAKHNNSLHLEIKDEQYKFVFQHISDVLGLEHKKIPFTRVISVVKNAGDEKALRAKLQNAKEGCQYLQVKKHFFVQLLDLPQDNREIEEQQLQWEILVSNFPEIFEMIDDARRENEPILIHCTAGRHRSVAILVAYFVSRFGLTVPEAFDFILSKRGCAIHFDLSEFSQRLSDWAQDLLLCS